MYSFLKNLILGEENNMISTVQGINPVEFEEQVIARLSERVSGNITMISACYRSSEQQFLQNFHGIEVAAERIREGEKVVLWAPVPASLIEKKRGAEFTRLVENKNFVYLEAPFTQDNFVNAANQLLAGTKVVNVAAAATADLSIRERAIVTLRHGNVDHDRYPSDPDAFLAQAKELGFTGTVEEVRDQLRTWKRATDGSLSGQSFPGLFVDVQGTLLREDGTLNEEIVKLAELATAEGPVTVWTDGKLDKIIPQLRNLGVTYPVVSKFDFHGATVEKAIDDKPQDEFTYLYGITVGSFLQV